MVVPQTPAGSGGGGGGCDSTTPTPPSASGADPGPDPAAEWLYLLFCRFVQERLCHDLYANVGIRAGGRRRRRTRGPPVAAVETADRSVMTAVTEEDGCEENGARVVGSGARVTPGGERGREKQTAEGSQGRGAAQEEDGGGDEAEEEDFFFPVTPEQLIALNLAEMAAGKIETKMSLPAKRIPFRFVFLFSLGLSPPTGTWPLYPWVPRTLPQRYSRCRLLTCLRRRGGSVVFIFCWHL